MEKGVLEIVSSVPLQVSKQKLGGHLSDVMYNRFCCTKWIGIVQTPLVLDDSLAGFLSLAPMLPSVVLLVMPISFSMYHPF